MPVHHLDMLVYIIAVLVKADGDGPDRLRVSRPASARPRSTNRCCRTERPRAASATICPDVSAPRSALRHLAEQQHAILLIFDQIARPAWAVEIGANALHLHRLYQCIRIAFES